MQTSAIAQKCDNKSEDILVHDLQCESPSPIIIAYKPQWIAMEEYQLPDDTFFLVIMTPFQTYLFNEFSQKIVCSDSTH